MADIHIEKDLYPNSNNEPLYGMYRGIVLENKDRSIEKEGKNFGRVQIHIPSLFDDEEVGVWALPANNPVGGRNTEKIAPNVDRNGGKQEYTGSAYIPPINSWVWVFFEAGDPNRPFYQNGIDIKHHELPPEMVVDLNNKPEERWLIFRSPKGRVIMISDDEENCRVEITGKKRKSFGNTNEHVYDIDDNMKTILIDDRPGKEKIIVKDEKGNFINIRTHKDDIDIWANDTIRIFAGKEMFLDAPHIGINYTNLDIQGDTTKWKVTGDFNYFSEATTSFRSADNMYLDSPNLQSNAGLSPSPDAYNAKPYDEQGASEPPNGKRDE